MNIKKERAERVLLKFWSNFFQKVCRV